VPPPARPPAAGACLRAVGCKAPLSERADAGHGADARLGATNANLLANDIAPPDVPADNFVFPDFLGSDLPSPDLAPDSSPDVGVDQR
jgi:hypothetical protein